MKTFVDKAMQQLMQGPGPAPDMGQRPPRSPFQQERRRHPMTNRYCLMITLLIIDWDFIESENIVIAEWRDLLCHLLILGLHLDQTVTLVLRCI